MKTGVKQDAPPVERHINEEKKFTSRAFVKVLKAGNSAGRGAECDKSE